MKKKAAKKIPKKPVKEIVLKTSATFEELMQLAATTPIKNKSK